MRAVVYGSRPDGHARVVIELFASSGEYELVGLVDDHPENESRLIGGLAVVGRSSDLRRLAGDGIEGVILGFGAARGRAAVLDAIEKAGLALPILVHPTAHVATSAVLSPGSQVLPTASVAPGARVGRGALVNTGAILEHDVQVAEAAVIGPGAVLAGRVAVGAEAEIGSGAVVLPDIQIGERAVVGAGAVVTRAVPADATVVGVPARILDNRGQGAKRRRYHVIASRDHSSPQPPVGRLIDESLRKNLERLSAALPVDDGGGSSLLKALALADLIVANDLHRAVEIGVYRGRLLLLLGMVMAGLGRGEVVGIDPYSAEAAVQTDCHHRGLDLIEWPRSVDWDALYIEVCAAIERWALKDHCRLIRVRSEAAAADFAPESIDLLHVDGNHDRAAVTRDVELFLPKMRAGGFIVLDDVSWPSVRGVYERLLASHELVLHLVDHGDIWLGEDHANDFAVFRLTSR